MTDIKPKAQAVMEQFLWEPKFSKRDEKLALVRALKELIHQYGKFVGDTEGFGDTVVSVRDILVLCEELENL